MRSQLKAEAPPFCPETRTLKSLKALTSHSLCMCVSKVFVLGSAVTRIFLATFHFTVASAIDIDAYLQVISRYICY